MLVRLATARGYAVVVQDVRGRYGSEGIFDPYRREGDDGYDTIEWTAAQPWCTGRVGTSGLSYPGAVQWLMAVEAPPHLACIFPAMCFSSARQFVYFGGAFDLSWIPWAANNIAPDERRRRDLPGPRTPEEARRQWQSIGSAAFRHAPLGTLPLLRDVAPFYFEWLAHPDDDAYWAALDIERQHSQVKVPAFNFSGWYDEGYGPSGAIRNFTGMRTRGATPISREPRLVIGPWTHGEPTLQSTRVGDRDFGPSAGLDYDALVLDWCDWHLRGMDVGLRREPPVRVFVMGANRWRTGTTWPLPGAAPRTLYFASGGRLLEAPPADNDAPDEYVFDPNDPVEDPHFASGLGAHDQRRVEHRRDVLVYTTETLREDVEVIGAIEFHLWVASSAPDTDFYARLLDVTPDGTAWNLMSPTLEVLRVKYRASEAYPEPMVPGVPAPIVLRLGVTANRFLRGHRIRVHVTSSFFPHLDRNPNTGRASAVEVRLVPARQRLYHDPARPSRVVLPVYSPG
jgi:putative CocE/NonD family hydrolase